METVIGRRVETGGWAVVSLMNFAVVYTESDVHNTPTLNMATMRRASSFYLTIMYFVLFSLKTSTELS